MMKSLYTNALIAAAAFLIAASTIYAQGGDVPEQQTNASLAGSMMENRHPLSSPRAIVIDGLAVGDILDGSKMHVITRPGLYGLGGSATTESRYGIIEGKLLRFDPQTMQLRAIIRHGVSVLE